MGENSIYTKEYIRKNADSLDWHEASRCADFSTFDFNFVDDYIEEWIWDIVSLNKTISETFIERYMDHLNEYLVLINQDLSDEFLLRHRIKLTSEAFVGPLVGIKVTNHVGMAMYCGFDVETALRDSIKDRLIDFKIKRELNTLFITITYRAEDGKQYESFAPYFVGIDPIETKE